MKFSTKVIIAVYVTLILFTVTMIAVFLIKGSVPDSLITCVFAACSVECGALGFIKHGKVKYGNNEYFNDNNNITNTDDINISTEGGVDNE